jgi:hypothetical protein
MAKRTRIASVKGSDSLAPRKVRLPGFVRDDAIGLGDFVTRATSYFGVRACGGCERRRAALNSWVVLTNGPRR